MKLLREELLRGRAIATAGSVRAAVCQQLSELGAALERLEGRLDEERGIEWARSRAPLAGLVVDTAALFGGGGADRLGATLQTAWTAIRVVAVGALIPAAEGAGAGDARGVGAGDGARIVLIGPAQSAGPHAGAAAAALENLARTLATEWARYRITATAIAPGTGSSDTDLATLVAYLLSPAGGYFTGCRFDLGFV